MTCGHSRYAQFCSEACQMEAHAEAHPYPEEWADECSLCLELVELTLDDLPEDVRQAPPAILPGETLKEVA